MTLAGPVAIDGFDYTRIAVGESSYGCRRGRPGPPVLLLQASPKTGTAGIASYRRSRPTGQSSDTSENICYEVDADVAFSRQPLGIAESPALTA